MRNNKIASIMIFLISCSPLNINKIHNEFKRLACYYHNLIEWDTGDVNADKANGIVEQLNELITERNNLLSEIDILLETSWYG